jgi:hypothetical protein
MNLHTYRFIRQLHLWVGAWGALAAVLFGITGVIQNHRFVFKLPQGNATEIASVVLPVPASARTEPGRLLAWLRDDQHLALDSVRVPPARADDRGAPAPSPRWNLSGGNARRTVQAEYSAGADHIVVRTSEQSPLAVLTRLHKGVGGGLPWLLLEDSFAVAMVCLGLSGLLMWARGRSVRQIVFSIAGLAMLVLLVVVAGAVA